MTDLAENGVQYRDDAAYVNTTMDHFEEKAQPEQIMEKTVDSIRDISTAIEESANSVGNAASSTTVLVSISTPFIRRWRRIRASATA